MSYSNVIAFDRPLAAIASRDRRGRLYTEAEVATLTEQAYHRGTDTARAAADQQMVELRAAIGQLSDGLLEKLPGIEPALVAQLRDALPGLAVEIARRLLAGYEPPAAIVARLCEEALAELFPERENLELVVGPRDSALLAEIKPGWLERYPALRITVDNTLGAGDCQVRSRFGITDARRQTKFAALAHNLATT
jgi:flagellar assembly protein FliH